MQAAIALNVPVPSSSGFGQHSESELDDEATITLSPAYSDKTFAGVMQARARDSPSVESPSSEHTPHSSVEADGSRAVQSILQEMFERVPLVDVQSMSPTAFRERHFEDVRTLSQKLNQVLQNCS
jgi:hypothetical protein